MQERARSRSRGRRPLPLPLPRPPATALAAFDVPAHKRCAERALKRCLSPTAPGPTPKCSSDLDAISQEPWAAEDCVAVPTASPFVLNCYSAANLARFWKRQGSAFKDPATGSASWASGHAAVCDPELPVPELYAQHQAEQWAAYVAAEDEEEAAAARAAAEEASAELRARNDQARRERLRAQNPALHALAEAARARAAEAAHREAVARLAEAKRKLQLIRAGAPTDAYTSEELQELIDLCETPTAAEPLLRLDPFWERRRDYLDELRALQLQRSVREWEQLRGAIDHLRRTLALPPRSPSRSQSGASRSTRYYSPSPRREA